MAVRKRLVKLHQLEPRPPQTEPVPRLQRGRLPDPPLLQERAVRAAEVHELVFARGVLLEPEMVARDARVVDEDVRPRVAADAHDGLVERVVADRPAHERQAQLQ